MPSTDSVVESDRDREKDYDKQERSGSKQKSASASSKAKDLSHVPCKFYKVGGCTAGSSCPFSHSSAEPGTQKEPCAWFVKGNCKFGHKCALAHILPGQSMSMDRKNKKAAQQAASSGGSGATEKGGKDGKRNKRDGHSSNSNNPTGRNNPLLAGGSTAPTRLLSSNTDSSPSGRSSMPLKASISPSAPAPPLKDSDFSSFAALDEMEGVQQSTPTQGRNQEADSFNETVNQDVHSTSSSSPAPLPTSAPRATTNMPPFDFGPIGSPPSGNQVQRQPLNSGAFTPGTSPRGPTHLNGINMGSPTKPNNNTFLSTSPFSAPGSHSVFFNNSYTGGGMAASLGTHALMGGRRAWGDADSAKTGLPSLSSSVQRSSLLNGNSRGEYGIDLEYDEYSTRSRRFDSAIDDGDMEDFIPSSLTDLLTPEERSRRMSRSGSAKPSISALSSGAPSGLSIGVTEAGGTRIGHRYSSSVPAPSLLGDIKSIWADSSTVPLPGSPSNQVHRGTPSASFVSRMEGLSINGQGNDDLGLSMSMGSTGAASSFGILNPSNASAAFLPNIHHNYLKSKTSQQPHLGLGGSNLSRGLRGANNSPYTTGTNNGLSNNYLSSNTGNQGLPSSASNASHLSHLPTYRGAPSPFDLTQPMHQTHTQASRPIPTISETKRNHLGVGVGTDELLSPSTRALQQHAPGQSLPQGLAAGYSRIHALPPLTSPGTIGAFPGFNNPAFDSSNGISGFGLSRAGASSPPLQTNAANATGQRQQGPISGAGIAGPNDIVGASPGLESVLNKLSYSAAAARGPGPSPTPPGLARNASGRYQPSNMDHLSNGPGVSPLRPRDDDDELFAMDK